jgi:hypothetical protein
MPDLGTENTPRERFIAEPKPGFDRRGSPREPVFLTGLLVFGDDQIAACVIVDRSESGFRIKILEDVVLPERFGLIDLVSGVGHECQAVWGNPPFAGTRKLASHDLREAQDGAGANLQRVWRTALA